MIIPNGGGLYATGPRRLVFAGEAIVDVLMRVPALPPRGGDALATSCEVTAGGGFNVMAAAARQGLPTTYAGGHGTGPWGDLVRAALGAEGIGLLRPPDQERDTGFDVALVEPDAERTFVTHLGAEAVRGPAPWDAVRAGPGDAVYVSGYGLVPPDSGPALARWASALPTGVLLFVDPGPLVAQIPAAVLDPVLARCDWLSCNYREAALLTNKGLSGAGAAAVPGGAGAAGTRRNWRGVCSPAAPPRTSWSGPEPRAATSPCSARQAPSTCARRR
jgi:sugar/nucleoside kinase (ribokinase family)